MRTIATPGRQLPGAHIQGTADRKAPKRWRRVAPVAVALALCWSSTADAQQTSLVTTALTGLVKGFTGAAGSELWGWMMGGGQSAGISGIKSELDTIEGTLSAIEAELGPDGAITKAIEQLTCSGDSDWIEAGPATTISTWYGMYSDFLTDYQNNTEIPLGAISTTNTDITTQYGWANGVIQGNANIATDSILAAMVELNNLALTTSTAGTIAECIKTAGNAPETNTLDDRPYYNNNVLGLTNYLLILNTQAMIVLTEAYHIYAFGDCVTSNGGSSTNIPEACKSDSSASSSEIITNLCPATGTLSEDCRQPITIYGTLATRSTAATGQFLPFTYAQFQAGGAPYSTDDFLMQNGSDYLLATSIEAYNVAADPDNEAGCSTTKPGGLTSAPSDLCGVTVGLYDDPLTGVAFGPYGYGGRNIDGIQYGKWIASKSDLFQGLLDQGFNGGSPSNVDPTTFLCTMSTTGGDAATCTQANGGAGLFFGAKLVVFPDLSTGDWIQTNIGENAELITFVDGGVLNGSSDQPFAGDLYEHLLTKTGDTWCVDPQGGGGANYATYQQQGWASTEIDPLWYTAKICILTEKSETLAVGWWITPPYDPSATTKQYRWPVLDWTALTCVNGSSAAKALNAAGVPTLCGADFDAWFEVLVPLGPGNPVVSADATLYRADRNRNDGVGPGLILAGSQPERGTKRVVVAFNEKQVQAFLDAGPLDSARLVLTSTEPSRGGRGHWVAAFPLLAAFVEGNGDAAAGDRGTIPGVTWNCAEDADISDDMRDCLLDWPRPIVPKGEGEVAFQERGHAGPVSWDVTEHVERGFHAWLLQVRGGGSLSYTSREGATAMDDSSLAPTLLLVRGTEETVVDEAGPAAEDAGAE